MTSERVSDERLAKMLAGKIGARDQYQRDTFAYRRLDDDVAALTELQSLRSAREAEPVRCVTELKMTTIADGLPVRDEMRGE